MEIDNKKVFEALDNLEMFLEDLDEFYGLAALRYGSKAYDAMETLKKYRLDSYLEGFDDGLEAQIEKLNPHPTEAITLCFNFDDIKLDELKYIFDDIKDRFPVNAVVAIPDKVSLESCSKDILENYISMIAEIIEGL